MATGITIVHDVSATLIESTGNDARVVQAARVSTLGENYAKEGEGEGLINFLMKNRHGSPFEHCTMTFLVDVPIFVMRELMRHRVASFNEVSGRYKQMDPRFYTPRAAERPMKQVGKAGAYTFEHHDDAKDWQRPGHEPLSRQGAAELLIEEASEKALESYRELLQLGIAKEVARMVLPLNLMTQAYMTVNLRSLMNLLSLRTEQKPHSAVASFPQWEIARLADLIEQLFKENYPITHLAWDKNGRVSP